MMTPKLLALLAHLNCGSLPMPPPEEYLYFGSAIERDPVIHVVELDQMRTRCRELGVSLALVDAFHRNLVGCSLHGEILLLKVNDEVTLGFQRCVYWHEVAHYHGWSADHPEAIEADVGRQVIYRTAPMYEAEEGVITSIGRAGNVFVRYGADCTSQSTDMSDLDWSHS